MSTEDPGTCRRHLKLLLPSRHSSRLKAAGYCMSTVRPGQLGSTSSCPFEASPDAQSSLVRPSDHEGAGHQTNEFKQSKSTAQVGSANAKWAGRPAADAQQCSPTRDTDPASLLLGSPTGSSVHADTTSVVGRCSSLITQQVQQSDGAPATRQQLWIINLRRQFL